MQLCQNLAVNVTARIDSFSGVLNTVNVQNVKIGLSRVNIERSNCDLNWMKSHPIWGDGENNVSPCICP